MLTSNILALHDGIGTLPDTKITYKFKFNQLFIIPYIQELKLHTLTAMGTRSDCSNGNLSQTPFFPCNFQKSVCKPNALSKIGKCF